MANRPHPISQDVSEGSTLIHGLAKSCEWFDADQGRLIDYRQCLSRWAVTDLYGYLSAPMYEKLFHLKVYRNA
jgi:hypothetical protein